MEINWCLCIFHCITFRQDCKLRLQEFLTKGYVVRLVSKQTRYENSSCFLILECTAFH